MEYYPIATNITEHNNESAQQLLKLFKSNLRDKSLINILMIDLSFIDQRATSSGHIIINDIEHLHKNTYCVHYTIDYQITNFCTDMDFDEDHITSMNIIVHEDYISFDKIEHSRDTVEEF